jgi:hypothetical protein
MIWSQGNRLSYILITAFTLFILAANFYLKAGEPLRDAEFAAEGTGGSVDSFIPSPEEEPALLTQTEDHQVMPQRTGFQRIFNFTGTCSIASVFSQPAFMINSGSRYDIKNTIALKLRI